MSKAAEWLYTKKNITGCATAVVAVPALLLTGLVAPPLALALIPAFYGIGALLAPSDRKEQIDFTNALSQVETDNVEESLLSIQSSIKGKVDSDIEGRVRVIVSTIEMLLPKANELGKTSEEMRILTKTATDYLPNTIAPYLGMPRIYAESKVIEDGKTSKQLLCDQLDLINAKLQEVLDAVASHDANAILSNGQFLKDRFGTSSLTLRGNNA